MEIQKFVQYTIVNNSESRWYIYITLIVGVKIVGRPDLAKWKTKICLIIVPQQVEEKVSGGFLILCPVRTFHDPSPDGDCPSTFVAPVQQHTNFCGSASPLSGPIVLIDQ